MARVIHFEIPAKNLKKQREFYSKVFTEWKMEKADMPEEYWLISTGEKDKPGIDGAFYDGISGFGLKGTVNTVDVADLDATLKRVVAAGGKTLTEKMPIPGVGVLAYCVDPEGTVFGVMQAERKPLDPAKAEWIP
jgi:predicted enzyme related to lactoylglutathione lyase